ncbi:histidine phosphatase family protein [Streptosporangium sp. KLBMP 9127]|nr:histidine phosphatase family protein [Streptosporangium sp. KLBMP 9127]
MTTLVLARHGETVWHAENRYTGLTDVELTPRGLEQAERLAVWASTAGLTGVWASPLSRARITAEAVSREVRTDDRLRELDFGQGDGLTTAEMRERFPEARAAFERDPAAHPLPGGEDPHAAAERFVAALTDIAAGQDDGRILVVAHTTAIRLALCHLIGVPLGEYRRVFPRLDNCGVTEIRLRDGRAAILQFNSPTS